MSEPDVKLVKDYLLDFQQQFVNVLEKADGQNTFCRDAWKYENGGGGITRALENGPVIEKSGVNFSHVFGDQLPPSATANRPELAGRKFQALGVSTIVHPRNPFAPTTHANIRLFVAEKENEKPVWWIGGGFDLTPIYGFEEDCVLWHQHAKAACEPFGKEVYPNYKKWADDYFYLKHRQEPRGIGGIFFDDLNEWGFEKCFQFMQQVGYHFIKAYDDILNRRKDMPYGDHERAFQSYRHGRYVEFNLVYDRGTLFGLQSGGRTESILISLPREVSWQYDWQAESGSKEARLTEYFLQPRDWTEVVTN